MEKNLIKYDLKKMFKLMVIYYIIGIALSGLTRFVAIFDNITIFNILKIIFSSLVYAVWGSILVQTFVQILIQFNKNFYGDESYLTHTLPVTKKQLLISKYISSLVVILASVLVLSLSVFIMFYSKANIDMLKIFLDYSLSGLGISPALFITLVVITLFTQICAIMSMCFAGTIIGKRFNTKKNLKSLLFVVLFYFASIICTLLIAILVFACMNNLSSLFSNALTGQMLITLLIIAIVLYLIYSIIFYFISKTQFEKGVNVD